MMFKNESEVVAKKAEKRYQQLAKQKAPAKTTEPLTPASDIDFGNSWGPVGGPNNQIVPHSRYPTPESMMSYFVPSIEDQAQGFFMSNYVSLPSIVPRGQFEWVMELIQKPDVDETLLASVKAATLAGFANATKNPMIMQQANAAYVNALSKTNSALRVHQSAIKDSTLVAVIMLGMYENFVMHDKQSIAAWAKHVHGACTLFKVRGQAQFKSDLARRIFHQFYGVALLIALETGTAVHEGMQDLYTAMTPGSDYTVHGRQYTTRMIDVMHRAINMNKDKDLDPEATVTTGLRCDQELDEIKKMMPPVWNFDKVELSQPSEHLYGNTYYVYIDPWIAQMWNNLNICRMYLYKIIRETLLKHPTLFSEGRFHTTKTIAEKVMLETAMMSVASAPQIVGMIPFPDFKTAKRRASDPTFDAPISTPRLCAAGTYLDPSHSTHMLHLIWPLYSAGSVDFIPYEMRQWLIEILYFIALRLGTRQAVVLADELKALQRTKFPQSSTNLAVRPAENMRRGHVVEISTSYDGSVDRGKSAIRSELPSPGEAQSWWMEF